MFNVIIISIVSMLSYISSEMIYPIIPLYLTTILGTAPAIVGLIEGIANSFSSILKFYGGYYSDKKQNKKELLFIGYGGALVNNIILLFAGSWIWILGGRIWDRFSKAIRTAPRDALVSEGVKNKGLAFGINEAFNALGSSIGILIAYFIVYHSVSINFKGIFLIATIPIILSLILLLFIKKEENRGLLNINLNRLSKNLKIFLFITFFSSLGNSTKAMILLKATEIGFSASHVILLYLLINVANFIIAFPLGLLATKIKMKHLLVISYITFSIVYLGLGISTNVTIIILIFILYGFYMSMIAVSSRTFVSNNSPEDMKATCLGLCNSISSFASLPATIITGFLWTLTGSGSAFLFSGFIGVLSVLGTIIFIK